MCGRPSSKCVGREKDPSELQRLCRIRAKPVDYALALEDEFRDGAGFMVKQKRRLYGFPWRFVSGPLVGRARNFGSMQLWTGWEKVLSTKWADGLCVRFFEVFKQLVRSNSQMVSDAPGERVARIRFKEWLCVLGDRRVIFFPQN
jgi:hypothetical protein